VSEQAYVVWWDGGYRRCASKADAEELAMDLAQQGKKNVRIREAA
jgi:hypothetical protein